MWLPTPPTTAPYTGKWIRADGKYGPYTPSELATAYNANPTEMAGTWIWEGLKVVNYNVRFDANGGTGTMDDLALTATTSAYGTLPNCTFTYPYHKFVGWNTRPDGQGQSYSAGALSSFIYNEDTSKEVADGETVTLYAQWQETTYTVKLNGNGASGSMADLTLGTEAGEYGALPESTFYWWDHEFKGWNTQADGSGMNYDPGVLSSALGAGGSTVTLYAQWQARNNSVNITDGEGTFTLRGGESATFENLPAGTSYQVWEETPSGWVLVSQEGQNGTIEPTETAEATFRNDYQPTATSISLNASKTLDGSGSKAANGAYSFTLSEGDTVLQTKTNAAGGGISFDPIAYESAGTHTYTIKEVAGNDSTLNYDSHEETVTVNVTDDGQGHLTAAATYDADGAVFANSTKPGKLTLKKTITGNPPSSKEFTFTVETSTDATFAQEATSTQTVTLNSDNGYEWTSGDLAAGTHYRVTETDIPAGYTQTVITGESGTIEATRTSEVSATNNYAASGSVQLDATKVYQGATLTAGQFSFGLYDDANANGKVDEGETEIDTTDNATDGRVTFDPITYSASDASADGTAHHYVIKEKVPTGDDADNAINYSTEESQVTVTVTDNGDGTLTAKPEYANAGEDGHTFTNSRKPGTLSISKAVADTTPQSAGTRFTFTVALTDASGTALGNADGPYTWKRTGSLTDSAATGTIGNGGTLQIAGGETVVISDLPDGAQYTVTETAADGFDQTAEESSTGDIEATKADAAKFTNDYSTSGSWTPDVTKYYSGTAMQKDQFTFRLVDENGQVLQTKTNGTPDVAGHVATVPFDAVQYTRNDLGEDGTATFHYTIQEQKDNQAGVTYDAQNTIPVQVTATDTGSGTLNVTAKYGKMVGEGEDAQADYTDAKDKGDFTNSWEIHLPASGAPGTLLMLAAAMTLIVAAALLLRRRRA